MENRPKTCVYYQKGECLKGYNCEFSHPTIKCQNYTNTGWCQYGHACHYYHDPKLTTEKTAQPKAKKICPYFLNNQCKYGDYCSVSHDIDSIADSTSTLSLEEYRNMMKMKSYNATRSNRAYIDNDVIQENVLDHQNNLYQEQTVHNNFDAQNLKNLNEFEINQLLKQFSCTDVSDICKHSTGKSLKIIFRPSDPEWPYDIKEILLDIEIPNEYPLQPFKLSVVKSDVIFSQFLNHLNTQISNWILNKHTELMSIGKVELYLTAFFAWFDSNLEELFFNGLSNLKDSDDKDSDVDEPCSSSNSSQSKDNKFENDEIDIIQDSIPDAEGNDEKMTISVQVQKLNFKDFKPLGKLAICIVNHLAVNMFCVKCKNPFVQNFNLHGIKMDKAPQINFMSLKSQGPYQKNCDKCHEIMCFFYQAEICSEKIHSFGFISTMNCQAYSILDDHVDATLQCIDCENFIKIKQNGPGFDNKINCNNCITMLGIYFSNLILDKPITSSLTKDQIPYCHDSLSPRVDNNKGNQTKPKSSNDDRPWINHHIVEGEPLPNNGSCKHYSKSYRWLKFPCCNRYYPCDICHANDVQDHHEMKYASKMLCGFCSTLQQYSSDKQCTNCKKFLTNKTTSHWEGGKGCRNKTLMSKKDSHKYTLHNLSPNNKNKVIK